MGCPGSLGLHQFWQTTLKCNIVSFDYLLRGPYSTYDAFCLKCSDQGTTLVLQLVTHGTGGSGLVMSAVLPFCLFAVQVDDKSLPYSLVNEICDRKHIRELDLSQCPNLEVLPAAFAACGLGRGLKVLKLPAQMESDCYKGLSPKKKLAAILLRQQRRQGILKLATQPEPMLTTLERLSWVLIILATITLTAFLQPGMKAAASGDPAETNVPSCLSDASKTFRPTLEAVTLNASSADADFGYISQMHSGQPSSADAHPAVCCPGSHHAVTLGTSAGTSFSCFYADYAVFLWFTVVSHVDSCGVIAAAEVYQPSV